MPALPAVIVDAHHHFWDAIPAYGFDDYGAADYLADVAPLSPHFHASIFVECNTHYDLSLPVDLQSTGETKFAAQIGDNFVHAPVRCAAAIIGYADPISHEMPFDRIIDAHIVAGAGRLRSIRRSSAWDQDDSLNYPILKTSAHMLLDDRFARALHVLADRDLAFDAWLYHPQLPELATLAHAARQCTIVLDHAGTPLGTGRHADRNETWTQWKAGMERLADEPNVHVKLGGFITSGWALDTLREHSGLSCWTANALAEELAPWLDHIVKCFGADRCLFESNFPVDKAHCALPVLVEAYSLALAHLGGGARAAIFAGNAARLYRVELPNIATSDDMTAN